MSSSAAGTLRRVVGAVSGGSDVYRSALLRKPPSVPLREVLRNFCSLIGMVTAAVNPCKGNGSSAYTFLEVSNSTPPSSSKFEVLLHFSEELAALSLKHVKRKDFIYVSGRFALYTDVDTDGNIDINYKVFVRELNKVGQSHEVKMPQEDAYLSNQNNSKEDISGEFSQMDRVRNRDYLWQLLFANPGEWRDYRRSKLNRRYPDFIHKDTGEALWLSSKDPPWVRRQLALYDSKMVFSNQNRDKSLLKSSWHLKDF